MKLQVAHLGPFTKPTGFLVPFPSPRDPTWLSPRQGTAYCPPVLLFSHYSRSYVTFMCYLYATLFFYYYFKYCVHICFNVYISCTETGQGKKGLFFVFIWWVLTWSSGSPTVVRT